MSTITSIEPQKKNPKKFNIYLDGKFAFGVSDFHLVESNLKVGKAISKDEVVEINKKEKTAGLTDSLMHFISYRPRSEHEVRQYLTKKIALKEDIKFSQAKEAPQIETIIKKLKKYKFINDLDFAKWFVASRTRSKPKGQLALKIELKRKGISDEIIGTVLEKSQNEVDLAKKAIEKKLARWKNLNEMEFKKKVYYHLSYRGFHPHTISQVFAFFLKKR